jgi:two-component system cell cycle sensor histidine kinase/response regulator CckA
MSPQDARPIDALALRRRAEEQLRTGGTNGSELLSPAAIAQLLHDLKVHQIELELQNEELRRAQSELEASRERYFDLYELAPVGYLTVSEQGQILEANLTAAKLLGFARGAAGNRRLTSFILPEDEDVYYLRRKDLFATSVPQCFELRMVRPDGSQFWARLEAVTAAGAKGEPVSRLVISDITSRKAADTRLLEVQKMETVGLLAGGIAHDFNNLLTVINGHACLVLDKLPAGAPYAADLIQIHKAGERAAELTQRLLAYARKQMLRPQVTDLNRIVTEMRSLVEPLVGALVDVRFNLRPEVGTVLVDGNQLEQVLLNLVLNARDAMPRGGHLVFETAVAEVDAKHAQSHPDAREGTYFSLSISDSGVGMSDTTRSRVFEPFFTTKEVGKGSGLGLSVAHGFISQSGGFIEVNSEPGRGTTFTIYLPVMADTRSTGAQSASAALAVKGRETVLVVEDQADVRQFVIYALTTYGYRVVAAANGVEALSLFENAERIDLILTDLVMPHIGGLELANRLKQRWPGLKVIFMSGYDRLAVIQQGGSNERAEFIQKPFSPDQLAAKVRAVLDRHAK